MEHLNQRHEDERSDFGSDITITKLPSSDSPPKTVHQRKWIWLCLSMGLLSVVAVIVIVVVSEFMSGTHYRGGDGDQIDTTSGDSKGWELGE